ncbi:MAG TPA: peptide ABC transporter substrate-binding protein [Ktedonobacteraceae bacterium]|nr:peptide ABC transporter substrate-binding protein [Ktedonobacteraceae bacterium]
MRFCKKLVTGLLPTFFCLLGMLLVACGGGGTVPGLTSSSQATPAPTSQQILRFYGFDAPVTDIATFDPGQATDAPSINAIQMAFTGLVQLDDTLKVQPQLASSFDTSADGLTYTFHLKPNLQFSDGTPLTSKDVAYSIDRALSPAIANLSGVSLTYLGLIKDAPARTTGKVTSLINDSILTPDDNTVVLKLSKNTAYFLQALSYPTSFVVEKSVIDKWGMKWTDHLSDNGGQGGDGPFMVKSYDHNTGIKFIPNPHYYGAKPKLQEADYDFYKDAETNYNAYQAGQIDLTVIPPAERAHAKTSKEYSQNPQLTIDYLAMNYLAKPFDNVHIRQAFELAINKDALLQAVYKGTRMPTCHIVPSGMYGYNPNLTCPDNAPTSGDAAKAKQLLQQGMQEEGWTSVAQIPPVKITYQSNSQALANEITTIRGMWQQVLGITVNTQTMDFTPLLTAEAATTGKSPAQGGLQMWTAAWGADYPDPQDWTTLQFGNGQPYNEFNYGNNSGSTAAAQRAVQQQLDAADVMTDSTARAQAYNEQEQQLVNDVAWLPLDQRLGTRLTKSYVIGIVNNAISQVPPDDWARIYIASH